MIEDCQSDPHVSYIKNMNANVKDKFEKLHVQLKFDNLWSPEVEAAFKDLYRKAAVISLALENPDEAEFLKTYVNLN